MEPLYLAVLVLCLQLHYSNAQPTTSIICLDDDYKCALSQVRAINDAQSIEILRLREEINQLQKTKQDIPTMKHCDKLYKDGNSKSGVYQLNIKDTNNKMQNVSVFCDMDTSGGGWTVFHRRFDGSVSFARDWKEYKDGFGDLNGEFWLGNEVVSKLASQPGLYRLRVDLESFNGTTAYAEYENFKIAPESDNYRLSVGVYSGTAGDTGSGLYYHNGMMFTTRDRDNDLNADRNCGKIYDEAGFWYKRCFGVNLNGIYRHSAVVDSITNKGIIWYELHNQFVSLKAASMKFRFMDFP